MQQASGSDLFPRMSTTWITETPEQHTKGEVQNFASQHTKSLYRTHFT